MEQICLFSTVEEKRPNLIPLFTDPVPYGDYMSIHRLIYGLARVEGRIEVKCLYTYRSPGQKVIADRAWVDPDTIRVAYIQEYKELTKKVGYKITPIAWGFGPDVKINRHEYETSGYDFVKPDDYYWVEEKFLKPKREEHNRNFVKEVHHGKHSRIARGPGRDRPAGSTQKEIDHGG